MATSTQDMVRSGDAVDLYYYDHDNNKKQAFPTTINTKYVQAFQNSLSQGGSSVFTIPPNNGVQDVVLEFQMNATGITNGGLGLPRGWGYSLIKQVSFRYGGSSQYFLTGDQILQNALRRQPSRATADDVLTLGGNSVVCAGNTGDWTATAQTALVVLTLPHATPSGVGKANPLPSDALTQQIQITVEMYPPWWITQTATAYAGTAPSASNVSLAVAQFQVQQVMLNNQGDALARRVDLATNAYGFPCEFVQQRQQIPLASGAGSQSVVLTGFRSGEVKSIQCWLTRTSEQGYISGNLANQHGSYANSLTPLNMPFNWYLPSSITMTYAGDVYARFEYSSSPLWNLINGNKVPAVDSLITSSQAANNLTQTAGLSYWVELPFAQTMIDEDSHHILVHGKPITNGIVNLQITPPSSQTDWVLNVSYVYNSTLLFSQGTCDYVF